MSARSCQLSAVSCLSSEFMNSSSERERKRTLGATRERTPVGLQLLVSGFVCAFTTGVCKTGVVPVADVAQLWGTGADDLYSGFCQPADKC